MEIRNLTKNPIEYLDAYCDAVVGHTNWEYTRFGTILAKDIGNDVYEPANKSIPEDHVWFQNSFPLLITIPFCPAQSNGILKVCCEVIPEKNPTIINNFFNFCSIIL